MSSTQGTLGQQLKSRWHKEGKGMSLKQFARKLMASGDEVAEKWFLLKKGLQDDTPTTRKG